jgi:hypothetical protein
MAQGSAGAAWHRKRRRGRRRTEPAHGEHARGQRDLPGQHRVRAAPAGVDPGSGGDTRARRALSIKGWLEAP